MWSLFAPRRALHLFVCVECAGAPRGGVCDVCIHDIKCIKNANITSVGRLVGERLSFYDRP